MKKGLIYGIGAGIGAAGLAIGAGVATIIIKGDIKKAEEERVNLSYKLQDLRLAVKGYTKDKVSMEEVKNQLEKVIKALKTTNIIDKNLGELVSKIDKNIKFLKVEKYKEKFGDKGLSDEEIKAKIYINIEFNIKEILNIIRKEKSAGFGI